MVETDNSTGTNKFSQCKIDNLPLDVGVAAAFAWGS